MNVTIEDLNMESFTSQKHYIPKDKNYKGKNLKPVLFYCHIKSAFLYYHQQSKTDANMDLYPYK